MPVERFLTDDIGVRKLGLQFFHFNPQNSLSRQFNIHNRLIFTLASLINFFFIQQIDDPVGSRTVLNLFAGKMIVLQ